MFFHNDEMFSYDFHVNLWNLPGHQTAMSGLNWEVNPHLREKSESVLSFSFDRKGLGSTPKTNLALLTT